MNLGINPIADESLISFIFRLALRRSTGAASTLRTKCGMRLWTNQPTRDELQALANIAEIDVEELAAISFGPPDRRNAIFRGRVLPANVFKLICAHRFVCPECLLESPHHRAIWDLTFISACPVHLKELVVACDQCGDAITWLGNDLTRCHCKRKRELSKIRAQSITAAEAQGTKAVYGLLSDDRFTAEAAAVRAMEPFQDLADNEIVDFLFRFGAETMGRRKKVFSHEGLGDLAFNGYLALTSGINHVTPWPQAFEAALDNICARTTGSGRDIAVRWLLPIERWLDSLPAGHGIAIRTAVGNHKEKLMARGKRRAI